MSNKAKIISKAEAKEQGLKRYFTGKPCKHGHVSERLVSDGKCCECNRIKAEKLRADNPDKTKAAQDRYRENNPDAVKAKRDKHYSKHQKRLQTEARERMRALRKK